MAFRLSDYRASAAHDFSVLDLRPYQQTATSRTFVEDANLPGYGTFYADTLTVRFSGGALVLAGKDFVVDAEGHLTGGRLQGLIVERIDAASGARVRDWSIQNVDMGAKEADAALRSATVADDQFFLDTMLARGSDWMVLSNGDDIADGKEGNDTLEGWDGDDLLVGGPGNDQLSGSWGVDTILGGPGDDLYDVSNDLDIGDRMVEEPGGGTDTVFATVSWTLAPGFENLQLYGSNDFAGTGNAAANLISGWWQADRLAGLGGDDTLDGRIGNDTLTGGTGADEFRLGDTLFWPNLDTITDFVRGVDRLALDDNYFRAGPPGALEETAFRLGSTATAPGDRILYDRASGVLRYDGDGSGTAFAPAPFAQVTPGTPLSAADLSLYSSLPVRSFRPSTYTADSAHDFGTLDFRPYQATAFSRTFADGDACARDTLTVRFDGGELVFAGKDLVVDADGHLTGGRLQAILVHRVDGATGLRTLDWSVEGVDMGARDADAALRSATTADDQLFLDVMLDRGRDTMELSPFDDRADGRDGDDYLDGDAGDDHLAGGSGRDTLLGGAGLDTLVGGAGDDAYTVFTAEDAGDVRIELAGGGRDVVYSRFAWTLADGFEDLRIVSDDASGATGNGAANGLFGNRRGNELNGLGGEDTLFGAGGDDTLTGGAGGDEFRFSSLLAVGVSDVDALTDFASGVDRIAIDHGLYAAIGPAGALPAAAFALGTVAREADDRILYDAANGGLRYDADGSGGEAAPILFARLTPGTELVAADFIIV